MDYYYLKIEQSEQGQIWKVTENDAERVGVTNAKSGANTYFVREENRTIWQTLAHRCPIWFDPSGPTKLYKMLLAPGEYYPRMARPLDQHVQNARESPGFSPAVKFLANEIATAQGQLIALTRQLQRICQTVHPNDQTLRTFGHDIRGLLLLACTEVEAHWRGILLANQAAAPNKRLTTNDYVKLSTAMKLPEFSVSFSFFPWLSPIRPFEHWGTTDEPTREIDWYAAYNDTKHDREANFARATLANAFNAVTACAVMMWAQFGNPGYFGEHSELRYFFQIETVPTWAPSDAYIFPYETEWKPRLYDFEPR